LTYRRIADGRSIAEISVLDKGAAAKASAASGGCLIAVAVRGRIGKRVG
jgi:hypothetical protein